MSSIKSNRKPKKNQVLSLFDKPIKPENPFFAFKQDISAELDLAHPNDTKQQLQEIAQLRWEALSDYCKKPYKDTYDLLFAEYTDKLKEWNNLNKEDLNKVNVSPKKHFTRSTKKSMDIEDVTPAKRIIGIKKLKTSVKSKLNATQKKAEPPTDRKRSISQRTKRGKSEGSKVVQEKIEMKSESIIVNETEVLKQQIEVENQNSNLKNEHLKESPRKNVSLSNSKSHRLSSAKIKEQCDQKIQCVEQQQTNLLQDSQQKSKGQSRKSQNQLDPQLSQSSRNNSNKRKSTFEIQSNLKAVNLSETLVPDQKVNATSPLKSHKESLEQCIPTIINSSKNNPSPFTVQSEENQFLSQRKGRNYLSQSSNKQPETRSSSKRNTTKSNEKIKKRTSTSSPSRRIQSMTSQPKQYNEILNSQKSRHESSFPKATEKMQRNSSKSTTPKSSRNKSKNNEVEEQDQQKEIDSMTKPNLPSYSKYSNKKQI